MKTISHTMALLLAASIASSCATPNAWRPSLDDRVSQVPPAPQAPAPDTTQTALARILSSNDSQRFAGSPSRLLQVRKFYERRAFQAAWTGGSEAEAMAVQAISVLARAYEHGLEDQDYAIHQGSSSTSGIGAAEYELALSDAVLRYSRDVSAGRFSPSALFEDADIRPGVFDVTVALADAIESRSLGRYFTELPPQHPQYEALRKALARYGEIASQGGWPTLPGQNEIRIGTGDRSLGLLIKRLAYEDAVLAALTKPSVSELRQAVRRFQERNGLSGDGRVGKDTLEALNVPASYRAAQIAANMERWRWMPRQFERRYITVNVPDQSVAFVSDGAVTLRSRAIVGRKSSATPITRTAIMAVVVNPPWNIPGDIAARDLLPHLRKSSNYLATRNMVVMDGPQGDPHGRTIDWQSIVPEEFPYSIRQLPGPATALGALMLDSPNDFDVYLHDTPNKKLYGLPQREISNGCVRVEDIFSLASLALTGNPSAALADLAKINKSRVTQRLALPEPLPVYFLYWTAQAGPDGYAGFRRDLYARDGTMIAALHKVAAAVPGNPYPPSAGATEFPPEGPADELSP